MTCAQAQEAYNKYQPQIRQCIPSESAIASCDFPDWQVRHYGEDGFYEWSRKGRYGYFTAEMKRPR